MVVQVSTEAGVPMVGRKVAFVASGDGTQGFQPDTAVTDAQGQAVTRWVLGTAAGDYAAEARIVALGDSVVPVVPIHAAARPGAPTPSGPSARPTSRAIGTRSLPTRWSSWRLTGSAIP